MFHRSVTFFLSVFILAGSFLPQLTAVRAQAENNQISLTLAPVKLPSDGRTYSNLYVQITGPNGTPRISKSDIAIQLNSSNSVVATVPSEITIPAGSTFTSVPVKVSSQPGSTKIIAIAGGYDSSSTELQTFDTYGATHPLKLEVSLIPPVLNPGSDPGIMVVRLVDSAGQPVPAASPMTISITNSSQTAAQVPSEVVIPTGSFMAQAEWKPLADGEFVVQAQASGVHSGNQAAKVLPEGSFLDKNNDRIKTPLTSLKAYLLSTGAIPSAGQQNAVVLQAVDRNGNPGPFPCSNVMLSSSDTTVISVAPSIAPACDGSQAYLVQSIYASVGTGKVSISAGADGLTPATVELTSYGQKAVRLELSTVPKNPMATDKTPGFLIVEVLDENNQPVAFHGDYGLGITGLEPNKITASSIKNGASFVTIPIGQVEGETSNISAFASGLENGLVAFSVERAPLTVTLETAHVLTAGGSQINAAASVTTGEQPVEGVTVQFKLTGADNMVGMATTNAEGKAEYIFHSKASGIINVSADATMAGYMADTASSSFAAGSTSAGSRNVTQYLILIGLFLTVTILVSYLALNLLSRKPKLSVM